MSEHQSQTPLVIVKAKEAYRLWHKNLPNLNKIDCHTIGVKIDNIFLSLLELVFRACFAFDKFEKLSLVSQAIARCDLLKFFLQLGWEHKTFENKKYSEFILLLDEVGRMLGGWKKSLQEKTPAKK